MHKFDTMTEPELREFFRELCAVIKFKLPRDTGFIIVCAPFGASGVAQYASNVVRGDAEKWMLETIARWNAGDYVSR